MKKIGVMIAVAVALVGCVAPKLYSYQPNPYDPNPATINLFGGIQTFGNIQFKIAEIDGKPLGFIADTSTRLYLPSRHVELTLQLSKETKYERFVWGVDVESGRAYQLVMHTIPSGMHEALVELELNDGNGHVLQKKNYEIKRQVGLFGY